MSKKEGLTADGFGVPLVSAIGGTSADVVVMASWCGNFVLDATTMTISAPLSCVK
jgi:hypothetical protein